MEKVVLIIAGGKGERLWPLSRINKPKQFLSIGSDKTLLENTIERAKTVVKEENIFIITGKNYEDLFDIYIPNFKKENIIFEPIGRDTMPAITLGAYYISKKIPNCTIAILPADPIIKENDIFEKTLNKAFQLADEKKLPVTIGIKPTRPEVGYGYIELESLIDSDENITSFNVKKFTEKPDIKKANTFLELGNYLWNAGMFIFDNNSLLDTIEKINGNLYSKIKEVYEAIENKNNEEALNLFLSVEKISFDFGVMEHLKNILCVKGLFFWDDLGSFSALKRIYYVDKYDNTSIGNNILRNSARNIILNNSDNTLIVLNNIEGVKVIYSENVFLVYKNEDDAEVKEILDRVKCDENGSIYT